MPTSRRDARSTASRLPSTSAADAVISEMTRPAPRAAAWRRNGASVTPDMGASITRLGRTMLPIASGPARLRGVGGLATESAHELGAVIFAYIIDSCGANASAAMQQFSAPSITFALDAQRA